METFMVHIRLPELFTQKIYQILNSQRERVHQLLDDQILLSYSMDMERKQVWAFIRGGSKLKVYELLRSFPIFHSVQVTIHELAFHDIAPVHMPDLILN